MTADELMVEYRRLAAMVPTGSSGHTCAELSEAWGATRQATLTILRKLHRAGLVVSSKANRTNIAGVSQGVPVYRMIKKAR